MRLFMLLYKTFKISLNDISSLILCTCYCDAEAYRLPSRSTVDIEKPVTLK
jgi:hypothetical protein